MLQQPYATPLGLSTKRLAILVEEQAFVAVMWSKA